MSLNVFLKMRSSDPARYGRSQSNLNVGKRFSIGIEPEIHRAHVERRDLRLQLQRGLQPFLDRHRRRAAGREVDDDVAPPRDVGGEFAEVLRILRRVPVDGIARVQMDDGSARFRRADRGVGDLARRDRQMRRHRRRVDRARHGTGDDDFAVDAHCSLLHSISDCCPLVPRERHQPAVAPARARIELRGVGAGAQRRGDSGGVRRIPYGGVRRLGGEPAGRSRRSARNSRRRRRAR